jgi:predicted GTPase
MDGLVKIIDTPGVEVSALGKKEENTIKSDIFKQTITAVHESDLIIVVVDARNPISSDEIEMVKYLRKFDKNKKIILACNKT